MVGTALNGDLSGCCYLCVLAVESHLEFAIDMCRLSDPSGVAAESTIQDGETTYTELSHIDIAYNLLILS